MEHIKLILTHIGFRIDSKTEASDMRETRFYFLFNTRNNVWPNYLWND